MIYIDTVHPETAEVFETPIVTQTWREYSEWFQILTHDNLRDTSHVTIEHLRWSDKAARACLELQQVAHFSAYDAVCHIEHIAKKTTVLAELTDTLRTPGELPQPELTFEDMTLKSSLINQIQSEQILTR